MKMGESLLGGSNAEKWGDHRKKKFFINNSVEVLISFKEKHEVLLKLYVPLRGGFQWEENMGISPKREFCL